MINYSTIGEIIVAITTDLFSKSTIFRNGRCCLKKGRKQYEFVKWNVKEIKVIDHNSDDIQR